MVSEPKYTSGPWRERKGTSYIEDANGEDIAVALNGQDVRLIAAAPDMFPIVQKWRDHAKTRADDAESLDKADKWMADVRECDAILDKVGGNI